MGLDITYIGRAIKHVFILDLSGLGKVLNQPTLYLAI